MMPRIRAFTCPRWWIARRWWWPSPPPVRHRRWRGACARRWNACWTMDWARWWRWHSASVRGHENLADRRAFYDWLHDGPVLPLLRAARGQEAEQVLLAALQGDGPPPRKGS